MTYGTSHLLIGGVGYFQGEGQEKYYCVRGGGQYMKNKIIRGGGVSSTLSAKKALSKNAQIMQKLSNIEKIFLARFAHSA